MEHDTLKLVLGIIYVVSVIVSIPGSLWAKSEYQDVTVGNAISYTFIGIVPVLNSVLALILIADWINSFKILDKKIISHRKDWD